MKKTISDPKQPAFRETTFNFVSILKVNKVLLSSVILICIIAAGVLGFTFGGISNGENNLNIQEASKTIRLDKDILAQDVTSLEIEKLDGQKQNNALQEQNAKITEETATISKTILGALMKNLESKSVTNRSLNVTSYIAEARNLIVLSNKLSAFKKTDDYDLIDLSSYSNAVASRLARIPTLKPIPGPYEGFGWRIHPVFHYRQFHPAADVGAATGTSVKASGAGYVVRASYDSQSGNCVIINHGNGFVTIYMHNSVMLVRAGQQVRKGDIIAKVGSTGTATGPHLHFQISYNGAPFDPRQILMQ
jgi:murein DD-endopeptidase MepM/ murein hydrolase activator NlpD